MNAIQVQLVQNSPEWNAWRANGIGSSDAPVIDGSCPYRTLRELFLEKTGNPAKEKEEKGFIFSKGHLAEALIRKEFQTHLGVELNPICFQHSKYEYLHASLDGFDPTHGVLEAKLVGKEVLEKASTEGEIPAFHYAQIQHQLFVSGADIAHWFGHNGKKGTDSLGIVVPVRANVEFMKQLEELEHQFWNDVLNRKAPALSDRDYLIPEDQRLLIELRDAKELAENAEIQYKALRAKAVQFYNHSKVAGAGLKLFKVAREGSLDLMAIPEVSTIVDKTISVLTPQYLESFRKKGSESWTVTIDKINKGEIHA